jgi:hypothetical protein
VDTHAQGTGPAVAIAGLLLDGRYRLDQMRADHRLPQTRSVLWRAIDEALGRRVAIRLVVGADDVRRSAVIDAATRASTVADARFVRVYDVGDVELDDERAVWIASEWVEAPSLAAVVRDEPLAAPLATEVARQCAEALAAAADLGVAHGRLHPDQVHLPAAGTPRISDLAVGAAIHGVDGTAADDVRAVGAVLFAALTGRWPLPGWGGLPVVAGTAAAHGRPRAVRAGVPRELDAVTAQALSGGYGSAQGLARALSTLPARPLDAVPEPPPPRPDTVRRWLWRVVPPLLVAAIGITGWLVGSDLGRVPLLARQPHAVLPPANQTGPQHARVRLVWRRPPTTTSFDPGGDGQENQDAAALAVDRDPTTAWTTDRYQGNPHLGGLKPGVGLLLDLGHPATVEVADLALTAAGADVELRAGDQPPSAARDLPVVARRADAGTTWKVTLTKPVRARFWLLWFTSLPPDSGGYRVGVAEVALLG